MSRLLCDGCDLRAKLSEYEAPLRREQTQGSRRSQALTVMWRRIFRGTLSAACELTVRTAACALCRPRGSYIIIMQHVPTHVRESLAIISSCTRRDLLEATEKCRCNLSKHRKTVLYYLTYFRELLLALFWLALLIINDRIFASS